MIMITLSLHLFQQKSLQGYLFMEATMSWFLMKSETACIEGKVYICITLHMYHDYREKYVVLYAANGKYGPSIRYAVRVLGFCIRQSSCFANSTVRNRC